MAAHCSLRLKTGPMTVTETRCAAANADSQCAFECRRGRRWQLCWHDGLAPPPTPNRKPEMGDKRGGGARSKSITTVPRLASSSAT